MFTRIADAARTLSISERFLRQLISENRIPFYRLSPRTLRVDLDELRKHMRGLAEEPVGASQEERRRDGD
jgi:excisionase family DNA binding protein